MQTITDENCSWLHKICQMALKGNCRAEDIITKISFDPKRSDNYRLIATDYLLEKFVGYYENQSTASASCFWLHKIGAMVSRNPKVEKFLLNIMTDTKSPDNHRLIAHGYLYLNVAVPEKETLAALEEFRRFRQELAQKQSDKDKIKQQGLKNIYKNWRHATFHR